MSETAGQTPSENGASIESTNGTPPDDDAETNGEYRVELEVFSGPLDLLLHLIKKDEIDIYDIPISSILDQFLGHLKVLELMDLDEVGDFLVMAANLMLIKARMLVPQPVDLDFEDDEIDDPRAELVQKLLDYQRYKEAAQRLSDRATERARRFERGPDRKLPALDPEDGPVRVRVELWDLVEAFAKIVREVGHGRSIPEVAEGQQKPMSFFMDEIVGRLHRTATCYLDDLFTTVKSRNEMVSYFMALLELMRQRVLDAIQQGSFGRIMIERNADPRDGLTYDAAGAEASFTSTVREEDGGGDAGAAPVPAESDETETTPTDGAESSTEMDGFDDVPGAGA